MFLARISRVREARKEKKRERENGEAKTTERTRQRLQDTGEEVRDQGPGGSVLEMNL